MWLKKASGPGRLVTFGGHGTRLSDTFMANMVSVSGGGCVHRMSRGIILTGSCGVG